MSYTREKAIEFWYAFDNKFLPNSAGQEILMAYFQTAAPDGARARWRSSRDAGTYPQSFEEGAQPFKESTLFLFAEQMSVMNEHFPDPADLQRAFEDFGQGVLFDDRRPAGYKLHTMDAGNDYEAQPFIGYHRWHAFLREVEVSGGDEELVLRISRLVGLAWAIQSEVRPEQDEQPPEGDLSEDLPGHRGRWLNMSTGELDSQFDNYPFPAF